MQNWQQKTVRLPLNVPILKKSCLILFFEKDTSKWRVLQLSKYCNKSHLDHIFFLKYIKD